MLLVMIEEKCTRLVREQMELIKDPLAIPTYRLNHSQYRGVLQAHTALLSECKLVHHIEHACN